MADTARDSWLVFRTLGWGPGLLCAGWVMCPTEFCGCKHQKLILAEISKVEFNAKILEGHRMGRRLKTDRHQGAELSEARR